MASKHLHEGLNLYMTADSYVFEPTEGSPQTTRRLIISRRTGEIILGQAGEAQLPIEQAVAVHGIMGIVSLSTSDFLVVITGRAARGRIDGHHIYRATDFRILSLAPPTQSNLLDHPVERHLLRLVEKHLQNGVFWFSYGWDLTRRMQTQATPESEGRAMWELADDRFFWNKYLQSRFIDITASNPLQDLSQFILPVVYGSFDLRPTNINGTPFLFCLISRRSRYRAGTRYFVRGLDSNGNAANYNETEQLILTDASPLNAIPMSAVGGGFNVIEGRMRMSFVQTRGSAPIGFAEINTLRYVPDLTIMSTPEMDKAHKLHMAEQVKLYGKQILVNLVNSKGREKAVKDEFERKVAEAAMPDVKYYYFDFHKECSKMRFDRISLLVDQLEPTLRDGGFFQQSISSAKPLSMQTSVVRSNCMDCLDRTNVTQAAIAKWSLTRQLRAAGILTEKDSVEDHPEFMKVFQSVWADHADYVSKAYAGTPALKTDFTRTGKRTREGLARDFWSSITRYAKNNFSDGERQDAFDLFTGAWVAHGGPTGASSLISDNRPLVIQSMPYVLFFSLVMIAAGLSLPRTSLYPLVYFLTFWTVVLALSALYIFSHGVEYVSWPRLNPPIEAILYDGPGYKTGPHGRGKFMHRLPLPKWVKSRLLGTMKRMPVVSGLQRLEEVEMASWGGNGVDPGVAIYFPVNGSIQEIKSDFAQPSTPWIRSALLPIRDWTVTDNSPIAAAAATTSGARMEIRIFSYDTNGTLRDMIWYGNGWAQGTLEVPVKSWGSKLAATAWIGEDGQINYSVWYTEAAGGLYEACQMSGGDWKINTVGHSNGVGGLWGKVWLEDGKIQKRVYFQNNLVDYKIRESSWNVRYTDPENAWSQDYPSIFGFVPTEAASFTAATFLSDGSERFFLNPLDTQILEFVRGGPGATLWSQDGLPTPAHTREMSAMSATSFLNDDGDQIYLVYTGLDGRMEFISWSNSTKAWSNEGLVSIFESS
ncbi:hypothetical protein FRB99_008497 [Tulasnella sp. 403]|nr:hypothetical protein FRB99_008497 [Tulasnella sp. 403]